MYIYSLYNCLKLPAYPFSRIAVSFPVCRIAECADGRCLSTRADSQPRNIIGLYKELMLVIKARQEASRVRGEGRGSRRRSVVNLEVAFRTSRSLLAGRLELRDACCRGIMSFC